MISGTMAGCAAWLLATGGPIAPSTVPAAAWPALIAFGACSAVAIQAFYAGVKRIGGARASLISTVEPVYTIAIATAILGEVLTPVQLAGGALVIAGVLLAESGAGRPRRRPSTTPAAG
jgi:drug/metabolite transporter (DMT)-like permease